MKNNIKTTLFSILIATSFVSSIVASLAWLSTDLSSDIQINGFVSSGLPAYFNDKPDGSKGIGTEDDPFLISEPVTLYNLAWLQYLGQINTVKEDDSGINQYYFKVTTDLDMSGWYLPPIGTNENPFVSSFDGGNHKISNLVISNNFEDFVNSSHPAPINEEDFDGAEIIGLFGVVGTYQGNAGYLNGYSYNTAATEVKNLIIDSLSVQSQTSKTLMGIIAGYLNAPAPSITNGMHYTIDYVGICDSELSVASGVSALEDKVNTISFYSAVGWCNQDYFKTLSLSQEGDTDVKDPDDISGGDDDSANWGGTIDMVTLNRRITYMSAVVDIDEATTTYYRNAKSGVPVSNNNFNLYFTGTPSTALNVNLSGGTKGYTSLVGPTYLPLNIDKNTLPSSTSDEENITRLNGKVSTTKSKVSPYNSSTGREQTSQSNTGYLVGSGSSSNGVYARSIQQCYLHKSLGTTNITTSPNNDKYTGKLDILTYDSNLSDMAIIQDENNVANSRLTKSKKTPEQLGLGKYSSVRESISEMLNNDNGYFDGIHFYQVSRTTSTTINGSNVLISEKNYANYAFVNSALNFTLKESGTITAVQASVYTNLSYSEQTQDSGFNLFKVTRNASNQVTSILEIEKVYKNAAGDISYNTNTVNGTLEYDETWYRTLNDKGALYYIEIPVLDGDYMICESNNSYGAYFMYLDIGANGNQGSGGNSGAIPIPDIGEDGTITVSMPLGHIDYMQADTANLTSHTWYSIVEEIKDEGGNVTGTETYFILPVVFRFEFIYEDPDSDNPIQKTVTTQPSKAMYSSLDSYTYNSHTARYIESLHKDSSGNNLVTPTDLNIKTYLCVTGLIAGDVNSKYYVNPKN